MSRYRPKTKAEIEAMTDDQLFNAHRWRAIIRKDDMQTGNFLHDEIERRRKLIFGDSNTPRNEPRLAADR